MLNILESDLLISPAMGQDGIFGDLVAGEFLQEKGCCMQEPHRGKDLSLG